MDSAFYRSSAEPAARRQFSIEEANRALVLVRRIVDDVVGDYRRLTEMQEWMDLAEAQGQGARARSARGELLRLAERIWGYLEELEAIGVELRDSALGVVDFPSLLDGRPVSLCWCRGEAEVAHWHEPDAEFSERRPLVPARVERRGALRPARGALAR